MNASRASDCRAARIPARVCLRLLAAALAALLPGEPVLGDESANAGRAAAPAADAASAQPPSAIDEEQAEEREHAQNLRRAREELEARRAEAARKLEAEQLRQSELSRLQSVVSGAATRESFLDHDLYWTQRERDSLLGAPGDPSAIVRRSELDHRLSYERSELERANALRRNGTRELNNLQVR